MTTDRIVCTWGSDEGSAMLQHPAGIGLDGGVSSPAYAAPGSDPIQPKIERNFAAAHPVAPKSATGVPSGDPGRPSKQTVANSIGMYSTPVRRLVRERKLGRLSALRARKVAAKMLAAALVPGSPNPPKRFSGKLGQTDLTFLSLIAGKERMPQTEASSDISRLEAGPAGAQVGPASVNTGCLGSGCWVRGDHVVITYSKAMLAAAGADVSPKDGVLDMAAAMLSTFEEAWSYYQDTLGMIGPANRVRVNLTDGPGREFSSPWGVIFYYTKDDNGNKRDSFYQTEYLPAHELFHQFQWSYVKNALLVTSLGGLLRAAVNSLSVNWWFEATAEWATSHFAESEDYTPRAGKADDREGIARRAAENLKLFWDEPERQLNSGGPTSDNRHYGELAAVEYFTQALGPDFVRRSFEAMLGWIYLDGYTQIYSAIEQYESTPAVELAHMWSSLYHMCQPISPRDDRPLPPLALEGWAVDQWCVKIHDAVPTHGTDPEPDGSSSQLIGPGGAWFYDLPSGELSGQVDLDLTVPGYADPVVWVDYWGETPGDWCAGFELEEPWPSDGHLSFEVPGSECPHATISVVNPTLAPYHDFVEFSWYWLRG